MRPSFSFTEDVESGLLSNDDSSPPTQSNQTARRMGPETFASLPHSLMKPSSSTGSFTSYTGSMGSSSDGFMPSLSSMDRTESGSSVVPQKSSVPDSNNTTKPKKKYSSKPFKRLDSMSMFLIRRQRRQSKVAQEIKDDSDYNFLEKDEANDKGSLQGNSKWWHSVFFFSLISLIACIVTLWAPYPIGARMPSDVIAQFPWSNGCQGLKSCICPRETICADDTLSMIFLTIARSSAWFDYPLYMLLFLSKARNLTNFLQKTMLKCWINFTDFHKVHALFGIIVGLESTCHGFFHILRWARRNDDIKLLWTHPTGITGLICVIIYPLIVLPMSVPYLKQKISFEWRKGLHYLSILWGTCLMYHAPQRIYWMIGVPLAIYLLDRVFGMFYKTHLVENAYFERLGNEACRVSFENPPGFGKQSAYVYIMLPWISKYQFHAFSLYPCNQANHSQLCISKAGGWTSKLISEISTPSHKPAFILGPFLGPFSSPAMNFENIIAVASGIGVTPAVSVIKQYQHTHRRVNLIWICRDPGLIEWFLVNTKFSSLGYTIIYYTGKRSLVLEKSLPPNILIYEGRPNLARTLSGIIVSIASGEGLPESLDEGLKHISNKKTRPEVRAKLLLEKAMSIYTTDQLFSYAAEVSMDREPSVDYVVNYQGVLSLLQELLEDSFDSIDAKSSENFNLFASEATGLMDRDSFEAFLNLMIRDENDRASIEGARHRLMFEGKDVSTGQLGSRYGMMLPSKSDSRVNSYLFGAGKFAAKNWSMLYCGGSEPVLAQLREYKQKHDVALSVEKFDW